MESRNLPVNRHWETAMQSTEIISQAKQLIEKGKADFANQVVVSPAHFSKIEYYVVYYAAIQLLLAKGFVETIDREIQQAYFDLIPEPKEFAAEKENFDNLYSPEPALRIKAAKHFSKQARKEASIYTDFLFAYPKTFEQLLPALQDTEPKVVSEITAAIGCGYWRYFKDARVIPAMYNLLHSTNKDILYAAIVWTQRFDDEGKWKLIVSLLQQKQPQKIVRALSRHFGKKIKTELKLTVQPLLLKILNQKLNTETKYTVVNTLIGTLDEKTINNFRNLIDLNQDKALSDLLKQQIKMGRSVEEQKYLNRELFSGS